MLEDTHSGMVKVKFHDREGSITAACVSEKATVYAFPHDRKYEQYTKPPSMLNVP